MLSISLKGMAARKLRTVLTAIAVVLGVALISGTYILTDTINRQFDSIFETVDKGIDVSVSPKKLVQQRQRLQPAGVRPGTGAEGGPGPGRAEGLGRRVRQRHDRRQQRQEGTATPAHRTSSPTPARPFDPFHYVSGHAPTANNTIAIDSFTAKKQHWHVGSVVRVGGQGPTQPYTVVGMAKFGDVDSLAGAADRDHAAASRPRRCWTRSAGSTASTSRRPRA